MLYKGPHISIGSAYLVPRVLNLGAEEFEAWPEAVRDFSIELTEELFLARYNPFIDPDMIRKSVKKRFETVKPSLSPNYALRLEAGMEAFWREYELDQQFRREFIQKLSRVVPKEAIDTRSTSLIECSTDATDLRMELPLLVVSPSTTEEIQAIVHLAREMDFSLVPRGGGSGLTGGAIPARRRTAVMSLSKLKHIGPIDPDARTITVQAGVITLDAIKAADRAGFLFTVDPASKSASSIGGNVSENSGGPFAFEYGTTLDQILSYKLVTPEAKIIEVRRRDHPRHKILPEETAIFDIFDEDGRQIDEVRLEGDAIRGKDLGKDVTNKYLGGLPGVQKEGVDGIITETTFVLHNKLTHSRTLCLEFFGRTMRPAMQVIKDMVALRDSIRREGDLVKMSALEEFGIKYVQAIEYVKKSTQYEGEPISVLLLQLDSDHLEALEASVQSILNIAGAYDNVDVFLARDNQEAEFFWEDRHKLSAIAKRTSGFKINEDIVIPLEVIPKFAEFLEQLNLEFMARAFRQALQEIGRLPGMPVEDKDFNRQFSYASKILKGEVSSADLGDQEMEVHAGEFFSELKSRYPLLKDKLDMVWQRMQSRRVIIANHMHAGDGNNHVNIPVNSNDPEMLAQAEEAAKRVFDEVLRLKGEISGEHGIGITKINYLAEAKLEALKAYKNKVDPRGLLNPGKLTQRSLTVKPYTFSFNRLIQDIRKSGLPDKDLLINLLQNIQICTRCGKCKQVCPMYYPQQSLLYHPRNKNISLGAIIEAIYYSQVNRGEPEKRLLEELRKLVEHCTACGKCASVCPVKIDSSSVALDMRSFLEHKAAAGHPIKNFALRRMAADPSKRLPRTVKQLALGQSLLNKAVSRAPKSLRARFASPLFSGPGPEPGRKNLQDGLDLEHCPILLPRDANEDTQAVFYFPGCGAGLMYRDIGLAAVSLLLAAGYAVVLPREHQCCGYPLLAAGCEEAFATNQGRTMRAINKGIAEAQALGLTVTALLTACGSCREGLEHAALAAHLKEPLPHKDVVQFLLEKLPAPEGKTAGSIIYHASCHAEWTGIKSAKAPEAYAKALAQMIGGEVRLSPGCCGESGLGAITAPSIYNKLRMRKKKVLAEDLAEAPESPILVGCPSCRMGIERSLMDMNSGGKVMHSLEYLASLHLGADWREHLLKAVFSAGSEGQTIRRVDFPKTKVKV